MDEIRSGSILKSVPEEMRPKPEVTLLQTAKVSIRGEAIESKSQPKKVIRLSQVDLIETDSEDEDVLSLKVGITLDANTVLPKFNSRAPTTCSNDAYGLGTSRTTFELMQFVYKNWLNISLRARGAHLYRDHFQPINRVHFRWLVNG